MFGGSLPGWMMWLVPIALVVALVMYLTQRSGSVSVGNTAINILKERYARSEIGKKEFDQKKRDIDGSQSNQTAAN